MTANQESSDLENKWREEFEDFYKDVDSAPNFKTNKYGDYSCIYAQENWSTYLAASKKAQEEMFVFIESLVMTDMGKASDMIIEKYEQLQRERDND